MRNKFPGTCYRCNKPVGAGEGHFERHIGGWRTQHADCAIEHRGTAVGKPEDAERRIMRLKQRALGTGKPAQKARAKLRTMQEASQ